MEIRDLFVAAVALSLGGIMLHSAILNEGWCFQMKITRAIVESKGRAKARTFIGSVGCFVSLLGLYLLLAPFVFSYSETESDQRGNSSPEQASWNLAETD